MKTLKTRSTYPIVLLASLPLLVLAGCAGNDAKEFSDDTSLAEIDPQSTVQVQQISESVFDSEITEYNSEELLTGEIAEPGLDEQANLADNSDNEAEVSVTGIEMTAQPQELIIGFAFDQATVDSQYGELLWQHAQYLKENSNLIIHINGHTDATGPRVYNEVLSKKRANEVASILKEFGVAEDRIKVSANADDLPLSGAVHNRENRRVELNYQDQNIVSN